MSVIVTVIGFESIWLLADRRLSNRGNVIRDDARKVMFLDTKDAVAIIGYAGLGATALGTEPSDWMSAVLRGRNIPLEQSLIALAEAMRIQFPRHLAFLPTFARPRHDVIISAFVGNEARLYSIGLALAIDRKSYSSRHTRHIVDKPILANGRTPRLGLAGSGGMYLFKRKEWMRPLLRIVRAYDMGKVAPHAVAYHLARLNTEIHRNMTDKSVGPRCVVCWRNRKAGIHNGGGGHQFYTGTIGDANTPSLPTIANGIDVSALVETMAPYTSKALESMLKGEKPKELNKDEINALLARLPDKPDENLR